MGTALRNPSSLGRILRGSGIKGSRSRKKARNDGSEREP